MRLTLAFAARYFKRYIERELTHDTLRRQWKPFLGWKEIVRKSWHYNEYRPWTQGFKDANKACSQPPIVLVEPIKDWTVFKGDRVQILAGKDKGKQGLVNSIIKERNWVYVEGLNAEYTMRSQGPHAPPMCMKTETPLLVTTQVKLVDPSDNEPTDVTWRFTEKGDRVRVSTRTGRIIPLPSGSKELDDFVNPLTYAGMLLDGYLHQERHLTLKNSPQKSDKDTKEEELLEVTFKPNLRSFEEDIMHEMKIVDTRKRAKTYWY